MDTVEPLKQSYDALFHKETYTAEEVAYLLNRSADSIRSAVWHHQLRANVVGRTILSIKRHDLLEWLASGEPGQ
jgi:excisionase family DNA binding protein